MHSIPSDPQPPKAQGWHSAQCGLRALSPSLGNCRQRWGARTQELRARLSTPPHRGGRDLPNPGSRTLQSQLQELLVCAGSPELGFPSGSAVKNLPAMQETWIRSLGWEDPLEKEMATHSSVHAWKIPWTEEPGGWQSLGSQESDMTERLNNNNISRFQVCKISHNLV